VDGARMHTGDGTTWDIRTWNASGQLTRVIRVLGPLDPITPELRAAFIDEWSVGHTPDYLQRTIEQNRFRDPSIKPQAETLGALRAKIDGLDQQIVELLALRAHCVRDATRFKRNSFEVSSPERQASWIEIRRPSARMTSQHRPATAKFWQRWLTNSFICGT